MAGMPACLLTPKGKLLAEIVLYDVGEELLALLPARAAGNFAATLSKMIVLSRSKMEDAGAAHGLFYARGPEAFSLVSAVLSQSGTLEPYQARMVDWRGRRVVLLSYPRLGPDGALILVPSEAAQELWSAALEGGGKPVDPEALEVLRVERGVPLFGVDMDEDTIPLEARLDDAISYTKGCYMGQETISRIHHMGRVNKILAQLKLAGRELPAAGAKVFREDREIGTLTSAVWSPRLGSVLALATIRVEQSRPRTKVQVGDASGAREAEVLEFGRLLSHSDETR